MRGVSNKHCLLTFFIVAAFTISSFFMVFHRFTVKYLVIFFIALFYTTTVFESKHSYILLSSFNVKVMAFNVKVKVSHQLLSITYILLYIIKVDPHMFEF